MNARRLRVGENFEGVTAITAPNSGICKILVKCRLGKGKSMWNMKTLWSRLGMSVLAGVAFLMGALIAAPFALVFAAPFVHAF